MIQWWWCWWWLLYFGVQFVCGYFLPTRRPLVRVVCRVAIGVDVTWGIGGLTLDFVATVMEDEDNSADSSSGDGDRRGDLYDDKK